MSSVRKWSITMYTENGTVISRENWVEPQNELDFTGIRENDKCIIIADKPGLFAFLNLSFEPLLVIWRRLP